MSEQTSSNRHSTAAPGRPGRPGRWLRPVLGALGGLVAGFSALAAAELASAAVRPQASPVTAVGGAAIDLTPPAVKDFAVRHFGTADKLVLQSGILAVLALFALALGVVAVRYRRIGAAGVLVFGALGSAAALSRPDAAAWDPLPSAVGCLAGAVVLYALSGRLATGTARTASSAGSGDMAAGNGPEPTANAPAAERPGPTSEPAGRAAPATGHACPATEPAGPATPAAGPAERTVAFDRRGFVAAAAAAAVASAGAGALGRSLNTSHLKRSAASRAGIRLPRPHSPAAPVPHGADLRIPGLSPFRTPNDAFYRVDTALVVPRVNAGTWRLRIHGRGVSRELRLSFADLLRRDLVERDITLTCVSNQVGGPYTGNARWIGARLADLLEEAGVRPPSQGGPADQLVARSVDGMTIGTPVETVMDGREAMLAVGMNGEPLPFAHGFPVRMVVPGLYGYVSACKWLTDLELTTFDEYDAYWVKRSWSRRAPIKTESRIDTPGPLAALKAGTVPVAGVAWAQHKGIARVEVRVDAVPWHTARLAAQDTTDTWRQWVWAWPATPGRHTLEVRATDRTGYTQTSRRADTVPDGATGWHSVVVTVT